jgi:hypothetical protein
MCAYIFGKKDITCILSVFCWDVSCGEYLDMMIYIKNMYKLQWVFFHFRFLNILYCCVQHMGGSGEPSVAGYCINF